MSDNMHYLGDLFGSPDVSQSEDGKNYCIAVPMPWRFSRLLMAWNVLAGRAVAIRWTQPWEQEAVLYRFNESSIRERTIRECMATVEARLEPYDFVAGEFALDALSALLEPKP